MSMLLLMTEQQIGLNSQLAGGRGVDSRKWLGLACISVAQLMVALDATVINIALPSAQHALGITDPQRQWVITAYTLAFGGLLILGGRVADTIGRRRAFLAGLAGFALASAAGGAAPNFTALVAARAVQGACAALLAPTFTAAKERAKAFAVFGAIAGMGGALGLLLGGVLTQYLDWRWCLFVNVPVAAATLVAGLRVLPTMPPQRGARLDVPGVVLVVTGLVAVVYGLSSAATRGWSAPVTLATVAAGVALIAGFLLVESAVAAPLLPLRILGNRNRGGAYAAIGLAVVALYGLFLLLTYDLQVVLHYSPVRAGLAFLPLSAAVLASSTTVSQALLPRVPPRALMAPGLLVGAAGMATLTLLRAGDSYALHVLPAELLLGLGMGAVFVPAFSTATLGVSQREAGVASAVAGTSQQIGTALLNTLAAAATTAYVAAHGGTLSAPALVHGYAVAAGWAAVILLAAAIIVAALVT